MKTKSDNTAAAPHYSEVDAQGLRAIGARVREARKRLGISQVELARRAGVTRQTIVNQETIPDRESRQLPAIAEVLGVSLDYLRHGVDDESVIHRFEPEPAMLGNVYWLPRYKPEDAYQFLHHSAGDIEPSGIESTDISTPLIGVELADDGLSPSPGAGYPAGSVALVQEIARERGHTVNLSAGTLVAIEIPSQERVLVRRLCEKSIAGVTSFLPDNKYYPAISSTEGARIVGIVVELRARVSELVF